MPKKISAGILLFRINGEKPEVLLVHPGGPFWKNKDDGAWSIPKGEATESKELFDVAKREFFEELGFKVNGEFIKLNPVVQKGGKAIYAWAVKGDFNEGNFVSNTFSIFWPPKSKELVEFPEVDKVQWFDLNNAREKLNPAQTDFIDQLVKILEQLALS
ncbi:MAG: NUDIX domain-containing protein [Ferruginibacter sp.]